MAAARGGVPLPSRQAREIMEALKVDAWRRRPLGIVVLRELAKTSEESK